MSLSEFWRGRFSCHVFVVFFVATFWVMSPIGILFHGKASIRDLVWEVA